MDDYDEEKSLAEITEKGLKPGELVGDLQDTSNLAAEAAALGISGREKPERGGAGGEHLGMYRAGGPTTIFGGSGWGPYSDGPLNAVRKSYLNRDGLNEENWEAIAAQRTRELDEEWKKLRQAALRSGTDIVISGVAEATSGSGVEVVDVLAAKEGAEESMSLNLKRTAAAVAVDEGEEVDVVHFDTNKRRRVDDGEGDGEVQQAQAARGVYDPQTGVVFCEHSSSILVHGEIYSHIFS